MAARDSQPRPDNAATTPRLDPILDLLALAQTTCSGYQAPRDVSTKRKVEVEHGKTVEMG
jgi:hypothetical protein